MTARMRLLYNTMSFRRCRVSGLEDEELGHPELKVELLRIERSQLRCSWANFFWKETPRDTQNSLEGRYIRSDLETPRTPGTKPAATVT